MKKEFKVILPPMPNFVWFELPHSKKEDGFKADSGYDIANFTMEEATQYAELMKTTFLEYWKKRKALAEKGGEG